eukprot:CAMPEP_0113374974 /NCGR_PEP_ID=MMETSP0013_2-20120614/1863_1 /TAXON_ID=2843 ORGANISM="Skeletonema costatum, Strain 1716" /NCGR_SAMPLE_ID=MMETSP0013_2 /ASSEMBLY_ACC=CAM_ASM_000158 /LENGTH=70 /DNA_ID=CAMNT_0000256987 /DNA_START=200 /DNA_END=409 /DNA_ORIENTATION=+ /assembly_acc=CAM_ASM_000158
MTAVSHHTACIVMGMMRIAHHNMPVGTDVYDVQTRYRCLSEIKDIKWGALHGADLPCYEEERVELRRGPS